MPSVFLSRDADKYGVPGPKRRYAFLQNQDRHVHLHVIPRYAAPRSFAGQEFADPDYPVHYAVPSPVHRLPADLLEELAGQLRAAYHHAEPPR